MLDGGQTTGTRMLDGRVRRGVICGHVEMNGVPGWVACDRLVLMQSGGGQQVSGEQVRMRRQGGRASRQQRSDSGIAYGRAISGERVMSGDTLGVEESRN